MTVWALLLVPAGTALAQQTGTVTGTVVDSTSGAPLPGVNVVVSGTTTGAATDVDGRFSISSVPVGAQVLRVSFISYETKLVPITVRPGENVITIRLAQDAVALEDIIVTALGIEREERSLGYSAQQVRGDELTRVPQSNIVGALQGRVAGASLSTSNAMGGSSRIVLRGPRSIAGNNQPLIVVDGIPLDNATYTTANQERGGGGYDYGNAAQLINADNVESVTVLQGATAAALYGSRASNGVIEIVTKSGRQSQGLGIQVSTSVTANSVYGLANYQDLYGGGSFRPFLTTNNDFILGDGEQYFADYATDQSWGPYLGGQQVRQWYSFDDVNGLNGQATPWVAFPNNVQDFFQTGVTSNTSVAFTQAGDNFNYRLSYTLFDVTDVFPNANLTRNQFALNGGIDLSDRLRVGAVANYVTNDATGRPGTGYNGLNVFQQFNHFGQRNHDLGRNSYMASYRRPDGSQRGWNWISRAAAQTGGPGSLIYFDNPYWVRYESYQNDDTRRFFGNVSLDYDIFRDVTVSGAVRTDQYTDRREQRTATGSVGLDGYIEDIRQVQETSILGRIQYDRNLTQDLSLTGFVGSEYRYNRFNRNAGQTASGLSAPNLYTIENSAARPTIVDYFEEKGVIGVFGELTAGYQDLVYLTGTLRNDWSSTLPEGENSYLYPSLTGSFIFTGLPALRNQNFLSFGKLRAGVAQTGNDTDPYRIGLSYPVLQAYDGNPIQTLPTSLNNANLRPEQTTEYTTGLELQFFGNRFGIDATYYYEISRDQILPVAVSRASGYSTLVLNTGQIDNEGFALALTGTPVVTRDARWDLTVNLASNRNEVVELNEELQLENYVIGTAVFGPQTVARVGEAYGSLWGTGFVRDMNGNIVLNSNGTARTSTTRQVLGNYMPDMTYGVSSSFSWRNLSLSALLSGQVGGDVFSVTNLFGLYSGILDETAAADIRELGMVPNGVTLPAGADPATTAGEPFTGRANPQAVFQGLFGNHEAHIYDATHLKLQELTLSYTVPQRWFGSVPVRGLTVTAIGRNLATLYKKTPNFDPAEALSATNLQGIEAGQIPPTRSFGVGVQFSF